MKKIGLVIIMIVLLATVANAASVNGDFKGNPIVKVQANGKALIVENTPAVIYNDNTLVPIYMLRQLGATVTWDQKTYSVDVNLPTNGTYNKQYAILAKKYKNLIDDINYINEYGYTMEFYYEENQKRSTTASEDEIMTTGITDASNRYSESVKDNQNVINAISPLSISDVYDIQNILHEALENYGKAYEALLMWKYALDSKLDTTDPLDIQAANNVAKTNLMDFDTRIGKANELFERALDLANNKFNISINEIK